jgi:hypothetical protein
MRHEPIAIDGISLRGIATPSSDRCDAASLLRAFTLLTLAKLYLLAQAARRSGLGRVAPRLAGLVETIAGQPPDILTRRILGFRCLAAIRRLERAICRGDDDDAHVRAVECEMSVEGLTGTGKPRPEIVGIDEFPELDRMRSASEHPSRLPSRLIRREWDRALFVLHQVWPESADEVTTYVQALLPTEMPSGGFNSASSEEFPFVVQVAVQPGACPLLHADSLIHETCHLKLDILSGLQPLVTEAAAEPVFRHPWRSDPRPLMGVLLGAHAFLNVMILYRNASMTGAHTDLSLAQYRLRRDEVSESLETLRVNRGKLTVTGKDLLDRMLRAFEAATSGGMATA